MARKEDRADQRRLSALRSRTSRRTQAWATSSLFDVVEGRRAPGLTLDLSQCSPVEASTPRSPVRTTNADIAGADVIIVKAAGASPTNRA